MNAQAAIEFIESYRSGPEKKQCAGFLESSSWILVKIGNWENR
jgi:hypothetical protein